MIRSIFCLVAAFVLSTVLTVQAEEKVLQIPDKGVEVRTGEDTSRVNACSLCFTCGDNWPVFSGAFVSVDNTVIERGGGCSGDLTFTSDSFPFLCCK